ncbi:TIGR03032 family protein [Crocosphaera sp. Alani8]|uniref:TIGR03032 family protein n=1 Tax=Crocosphaera sp. Alani8 TaxID=3038952 RepID=UPI00313DBEFF
MKLDTAFYKLPVSFDAEKLAEEIAQFNQSDWRPHPQGVDGNFFLPLIAVGGNPNNDSLKGAMFPTPFFKKCPYLQQILAIFKTLFGRTRLTKIKGDAEPGKQVKTNYYWLQRVQIHFPIITSKEVNFICGDNSVNMKAGEVWIFDTWRQHHVINPTQKDRIHLVADTVGSPFLWDLVSLAEQPFNLEQQGTNEILEIVYNPQFAEKVATEKINFSIVMSPWEQKCLISTLFEDLAQVNDYSYELVQQLERILVRFCRHWQSLWSEYGTQKAGWASYSQVLQHLDKEIAPLKKQLILSNQIDTVEYLQKAIIEASLNPKLATISSRRETPTFSNLISTIPPNLTIPSNFITSSTSITSPLESPFFKVSPDENCSNVVNSPLRSVHTANFAQILSKLGISLIVSTYQAGKLILIRADGDVINTHFRLYQKPMGIAASPEQIAVGTESQILQFQNIPALSQKLNPPNKHDACYLPRKIYITGDIDIHEMNWGDEGLWFINTRFCCLCTLDQQSSFVPRWQPNFISALVPEDRCHLNGLGMVEGHPKYVTALGTTDTPGGWRKNKAQGGVLLDIETGEIIVPHLSMPHSPRWYRDRLWVLESGQGSLGAVDVQSGQLETLVQFPGFTRGLDFWGPLAFIGLSQVRETAVFSSIPLTKRLDERLCGIWVVNIETAQTVAFLKFEAAVQEIFSVQILPGIRFPEILDIGDDLINSSYTLPDGTRSNGS